MKEKRRLASRLMAVLLASVMAFALAACGENNNSGNNNNADSGAASSASNGPLEPMAQRIVLTAGIGYNAPESANTKAGVTPETNSLNDILLERLNIEIKYSFSVPSEQFRDRFQLSVATGDIPDILRIEERDFMDFAMAGMLTDLQEAYDTFALQDMKDTFAYFNDQPLQQSSRNGKLLAIPYCTDSFQQVNVLFYRNDWLEALNLSVPKTINDMAAVAKAFSDNDISGKGTTGLGLYKDIYSWSLDARGLFHGYGAYPTAWLDRGGELVYGTIQPETKKGLDKLRQMYAEGSLNREFATYSIDQLVADVVAGKVGMLYGEWWVPNWPLNNNLEAERNADWRVTYIPSESHPAAKTIITRNNINRYNCVSAKAPAGAAEAAVKMLNLNWDISFSPTAEARYGEQIKPESGYVYNWSPIYTYFANEQTTNYYTLQEATEKNDKSLIKTRGQNELWTAYQIFNGGDTTEEWPYYRAWGLWYSRGAKDGGWGLTMDVKNAGNYIYNEYYGDITPTELSKGSTLKDMWDEFATRYIMGSLPDSSWAQFVSDWKALGGDDWTREVNEQYKELK